MVSGEWRMVSSHSLFAIRYSPFAFFDRRYHTSRRVTAFGA